MSQFFGKYRGKVLNNADPLQLARVQVSCPAVLGDGRTAWAMPSAPLAGSGVGLFAVPPVGANVWVEFEGGDPDYPIVGGCFWATGEVPASPALAATTLLKTGGIALTLNEAPGAGGLTIEIGPPAVSLPVKLVLDSQGVAVSLGAGAIKLTSDGIELTVGAASVKLSPSSVNINNGALEVI